MTDIWHSSGFSCHLGNSAVALMNSDDSRSHQLSTRMEMFMLLLNDIHVSTASLSLSAPSLLLFQTGWSTAWTQTAALKFPARVRPTVVDHPTPWPSPVRVRAQPSRPQLGAFMTVSVSWLAPAAVTWYAGITFLTAGKPLNESLTAL